MRGRRKAEAVERGRGRARLGRTSSPQRAPYLQFLGSGAWVCTVTDKVCEQFH